MLCDDVDTFRALNALESTVRERHRSLVIWLGAGASAWAGYPLWQELAAMMHSSFAREAANYDTAMASDLLNQAAHPRLFQLMRESDSRLYFNLLKKIFLPKTPGPVYRRLLNVLDQISPTCVLTTNVDEILEQNLPGRQIVQYSDIEQVPQLLFDRTGFIGKLHGSISSIESIVFSKQDYYQLERDGRYLDALHSVFSTSTVLFLGYGLQDEHVITALQNTSRIHPLFGMGPHFLVVPEGRSTFSSSVRVISYLADPPDHRSALLVLEDVVDSTARKPLDEENFVMAEAENSTIESVYFLSELFPPGQWNTSQTVNFRGVADSQDRVMVTGEGYDEGEVILDDYSALHDVVVGLICFDVICLSIDHLQRLHSLLGSSTFWTLVTAGSIRLVVPPQEPAVVFPNSQSVVGDLTTFAKGSRSSSFDSFSEITISEKEFVNIFGRLLDANQSPNLRYRGLSQKSSI